MLKSGCNEWSLGHSLGLNKVNNVLAKDVQKKLENIHIDRF